MVFKKHIGRKAVIKTSLVVFCLLVIGFALLCCGCDSLITNEHGELFSKDTSELPGWLIADAEKPDDPFVVQEYGLLFEEDFSSGRADGWSLGAGWSLEQIDDNYVLIGTGHHFADPRHRNWTDYTVQFNLKRLSGDSHFNFRFSEVPGHGGERYFIGNYGGDLALKKQIVEDYFQLTAVPFRFGKDRWYDLKVALDGNNIKVYVDDQLKIDYTDVEMPLRSGGISFETFEGGHFLYDNITVHGTKHTQRASWVKTGGPRGGLGYDVRIHPIDYSIMFATDNPSGVNKSYDGGENWVQRNTGITSRSGGSMDGIPIFCLTIDHNNPDIVWAGTQFMRGIYKSVDGGETWTKKDTGVEEWDEITFRNFGIHPQNSDIVFAGAEISTGVQGFEFEKVKGKIYKTEDGGETWRSVWEGDSLVRFILFDYHNPDTLYASTGIFDREAYNEIGVGVLKSTDGGETWKQINNGIKHLFIGFLEMHPQNPEILYAAAGNEGLRKGGEIESAIYRTTDGGNNWEKLLTQYTRLSVVTISPANPDLVYAAGESFFRSNDGGNNWQDIHYWGMDGMNPGTPISGVVSPVNPMTVFINSYDGAVLKTTDGGQTWTDASRGYTGADMRDITIFSDKPHIVYAVSKSGIARSYSGGEDWEEIAYPPMREPNWYAIALNPRNSSELLVAHEMQGSIHKSSNGGNSWSLVFKHPGVNDRFVTEKAHGFKTIVYSQSDPDVIYAGMARVLLLLESPSKVSSEYKSFGIYKSTDGGRNWQEKNTGLEGTTKNIHCIAVHPTNPDIAYIGTVHDGAFKTINGGETWTAINNGLMSLDVRSLAIDFDNPETIYAGLGEGAGIYKSSDGGMIWEGINHGVRVECPSYLQRVGAVSPGISLNIPKRTTGGDYYSLPWSSIESIVIDPADTQTIYAADFYLGVYMSTDGGENWLPINEGLTTKSIRSMAISSDGRVLYAATSGEGVFRLLLW